MVLSLILLSVVSLVVGEYEVGRKYNYFYDADSAMTSKTVDSLPNINTYNFSCIVSIACLSANKDGFQFKLELSGIHLIQRDIKGKIISDASGLKVEGAFSNEFIFTILRTGAVGEVKHVASDSEEIVKIKTGIISQFITLGDNETDDEPTETLDNQGMYLSHWKRGKKRERDDVVELTRHYTDEDFIHHLDKNITEDSFILSAVEKKKMRSGVVTESVLDHNLYFAGKEFYRRGRRIGDDTARRKRMATSNDDFYNGTELSYSSSSSLQHISTVSAKRHPRRVSSSNAASGRSEKENVAAEAASSRMKLVTFFNKDFYAEKVELNQTQKAVHLKENSSSSFASLVKREKNFGINLCESKDDDEKNETKDDKDKDEKSKDKDKEKEDKKKKKEEKKKKKEKEEWEKMLDKKPPPDYENINDIFGDIQFKDGTFSVGDLSFGGDDEEEEEDLELYEKAWEYIWDWATVKTKANSETVSNEAKKTRSYQALSEMTREDVFRLTSAQVPVTESLGDAFSVSEVKDRDWERRRYNRIHRFTLGGIDDALAKAAPAKLCAGFEAKNDEVTINATNPNDWRPVKLFPQPELEITVVEEEYEEKSDNSTKKPKSKGSTTSLYSRLSQSYSSSDSPSLLSPSPFDSFSSTSNGNLVKEVVCPKGSGLTLCFQIGDGKKEGNDDFGTYMQGVIYTGSQKIPGGGKACAAQGGCAFLLDIDTGIYIKVMGFNLTIISLAVCSFRVNNFPGKAYMSFILFNIELGCHFQDSGCAEFEFVICEVEIPIPNLGYSFKQSFMIFEIVVNMGLFATFKLAFVFEVCPSEGSVAASLPPTFGIKFALEATLKILKSEAGLGLSACTELSIIPQIALNLSVNSIVFSLKLKWVAIAIQIQIEVKICILILPCFGGKWQILDWKTNPIILTIVELYWPLPFATANDAYTALDGAVGNGTESEIKAELGKKEVARSAVSSIGESLDVLLTDTDAGFELVTGVNTNAEVAKGGDGASNN